MRIKDYQILNPHIQDFKTQDMLKEIDIRIFFSALAIADHIQ